ncbi:AfsR/SARP family transcriptional regulator [Micromonospora lupini]|uniref:AfsR/SARP family transcriptional regulator n=1 Tax=Micromonospora lupini TaxID=285679 RepID=UPI00225BA661|nr:AfsR/SARP family transcriptional regulator [Micromonospora lupini]MCX5066991.1 AfsR/SARP family transcriptional regulator [Micromonospora lupini]
MTRLTPALVSLGTALRATRPTERRNVEFAILGPLEVRSSGAPVDLPAPRQRRILAALLVASEGWLSVNRLIEACWDDAGPWTARKQVQNQVGALRRHLVRHGGDANIVVTRPDGYQLDVSDAYVDAREFAETVRRARQATEIDTARAVSLYHDALTLWRGPALDGLNSPALEPAAARLAELRLLAAEERYDLELRLGRHRQVLADLIELAAEHPSRERLQALLMLALHREGRQVEAHGVYRRLHDHLAEELGTGPGGELRELRERLLCDRVTAWQPNSASS